MSSLTALADATSSHLTAVLTLARSHACRRLHLPPTSTKSITLTIPDLNAALTSLGHTVVYPDSLPDLPTADPANPAAGVDLNDFIGSFKGREVGSTNQPAGASDFSVAMDWVAVDGVSTLTPPLTTTESLPLVLSSLLLSLTPAGIATISPPEFQNLLTITLSTLPPPTLTTSLLPPLLPLLTPLPTPRTLTTLHSLLLSLATPTPPFLALLHNLLPPLITLTTSPHPSLPPTSRQKTLTILRTITTLTLTAVPTLRSRLIAKACSLFTSHLRRLEKGEGGVDAAVATLQVSRRARGH